MQSKEWENFKDSRLLYESLSTYAAPVGAERCRALKRLAAADHLSTAGFFQCHSYAPKSSFTPFCFAKTAAMVYNENHLNHIFSI